MKENITYTLKEKQCKKNLITYEDLLKKVNTLNTTREIQQLDCVVAMEIDYNCNYLKKEIIHIAEYYNISKRKKKKIELIQEIISFENDPENYKITMQRKKLWKYMEEIKSDNYLSKFLIFN